MDMSQRASWDWKEVCGRSIPQLEQGSKRPAGFEVCSPMEGQAHRRSGVACILGIGEIRVILLPPSRIPNGTKSALISSKSLCRRVLPAS